MIYTTQGVSVTPGETMPSPDIARMLDNSKELDRLRRVQEEVLLEISNMHDRIRSSSGVLQRHGDIFLTRLKTLYTQAKELSESEVNWGLTSKAYLAVKMVSKFLTHVFSLILLDLFLLFFFCSISTQLLGQLDAFMPPGAPWHQRKRIEPNEPKRKQLKADSDISTHSPSVQKHLDTLSSLTGEQVAARVTNGSEKEEWFVVKVLHFGRETREVEVLDEEPGDDEEGGSQRKYKLPISEIIPFPKWNDISGVQDFRTGEKVLALYPDTTALYKATVVQPRKVKSLPICVVLYLTIPLLNFNKPFGLVPHVSEPGGE
ncbi:hypothetical protein RHSIM_Rhsim08G0048300 [Rhododendron simsii]|uniref:SGF29 C-terminal domain-containing protein n=1 Tax=Rhododendron simsii TaxID=118357 RepID=A0A834GKG7_RHOSS|nr:hypothetical protein RHSIM_Rhsim08G0048300 [Rhododendron simsii]